MNLFHKRNEHCSYCGGLFLEGNFPKTCLICKNISYLNPVPVSVSLIHAFEEKTYGLLLVRRAQEPQLGQWAFPGGYIELGETWQEGAVREIKEETGLLLKPEDMSLISIEKATNGNFLIFNHYNLLINWKDIEFIPNNEVSEIKLTSIPIELAFPLQTSFLKKVLHG